MKKPLNVRLPVLFAVSLSIGIVYSTVLAYFRLNGIFILIPALIVFAACIPVAIVKGGASKPLIAICAILFFLVGAVYMYAEYLSFESTEVLEGVLVKISGRVDEAGVSANGNRFLIISNVTVNGEKINGKIIAYLTENITDDCRRGYTVNFYSQLSKQSFVSFGGISYNATRGIKYMCTVSGLNCSYRFDLFGEINSAFERALYNNLDSETAAVCFAMLTGNTDGISAGTLSSFRNGGIAHVFAVSGLHIGVIYGALTFLFKKLGLNRYVSTAVRIAFIAVYSGVCLFSPSSVRALVMCSASAVAGCFHRKHDSLNALAVAAVILLLINPLYLFGVGFVLSFSAVLGIILLSKNLKRLFGFLPEKCANALSAGLSAQVATVPVQLTSFGYISAAGLILNLLIIPLVSVMYVSLFICTLLSVIMPFSAGVLMHFAAVPIQLVINVVTACGFENAVITGSYSELLYVPFALLFIGLTDKLNLRPLFRTAFVSVFAVVIIYAAVASYPRGASAYVGFNSGYRGGSVTVKTNEGTVLIVTSNFRGTQNTDAHADVLVVLGYDDELAAVTSLGGEYGSICVRGSAFPYPPVGDTPVIRADSFTVCGVDFAFGDNSVTANVYGTEIALVYDDGGSYSAGKSGCTFELYCYGDSGAVLYADGGSYALDYCGEMRFEISVAGYNPLHVIPKEW
ncbi:MAG: ComEC/Rec2 family competence protein [Clostridia bacterium]|nr:ComEC/Rec2 family competence protein [Clostridia bacterium]